MTTKPQDAGLAARSRDAKGEVEPARSEAPRAGASADDAFWCPGCSARLVGRSCKLRCTRCGYFEDCSNLI